MGPEGMFAILFLYYLGPFLACDQLNLLDSIMIYLLFIYLLYRHDTIASWDAHWPLIINNQG